MSGRGGKYGIQPGGYREFRRAEIPNASDFQDQTILIIEADGSRTLLFSDGVTWRPSGGGGVALSAGTNSLSSGTVNLSNSNGVSFGMNSAGVVTASVAGTVAGGGQVNVSAGASSVNASSVVFSNSNGMTFGASTAANGATVTGSYSQSTAPAAIYAGAAQVTSGTLTVSNSNGVSFGIAGQTMTASVAAQTAQTMGVYATNQTTGQASSSTVDARSLSVSLLGGLSGGLSAGMLVLSGAAGGAGGGIAEAGGTQTATSGTVFWSNSNGVSFGMSGTSRMTATFALSNQTLSAYAVGNTTQSSSGTINVSALSVSAAGNMSVGVSNGSLVLSANSGTAAQTNQTMGIYGSSQTTGQASSSTVDARSLSIVAAGLLSVGMSAGSLVLSAPDTTSYNPLSVGFSTGGNTAGTTGFGTDQVVFAGGANITLSGSTNAGSMTVSVVGAAAAAGVAQAGGTQTATSGTVVFSNSNNVSFGMSGSSRMTASYAFNVSAGTTSNNVNAVTLSNSNGMSFGLNGSTLTGTMALSNQTISAFAVSNTTQSSSGGINVSAMSLAGAGGVSVGVSNGSIVISGGAGGGGGAAISAGTQSVSTGTVAFSNSNGITFGMSGSNTVTASFALSNQVVSAFAVSNTTQSSSGTVNVSAMSFQGNGGVSMGVSNGSIVASAPATSSLSATGAVSISTNGATISIGVPGGTLSKYEWPPSLCMNISSSQQTNSVYSIQHLSVQQPISFSRVDVPLIVSLASAATSNTAAVALSAMMVLYTRNGSTFNPIVGASASSTFSWASSTSNFSQVSGAKQLSFALATVLTPGEYWAGFYMSTTSGISSGAATTALNATFSIYAGSVMTDRLPSDFNVAPGASSNRITVGVISSVPTNTTQSLQQSQMELTGTAHFRANVPLMYRNY